MSFAGAGAGDALRVTTEDGVDVDVGDADGVAVAGMKLTLITTRPV